MKNHPNPIPNRLALPAAVAFALALPAFADAFAQAPAGPAEGARQSPVGNPAEERPAASADEPDEKRVEETTGETTGEATEEPAVDAGLRAEITALRARLSDLEEELASRGEPAGESTPAAPAQDDDDGASGTVSTGGQDLTLTGLVDTYYTRNANDPADGTNTLYYTNPNSRGFGLNQVKLELDASGDGPIGFRSDIWFGSGARLFREGLEPGPLADVLYLQQAYGYYQFEGGAQMDVGLFGTIAGLEVAESHLNWNYTRGLLWAWNEPFSHLGAKVSFPVGDTLTGTLMLVNGFDNAFDQNSGKSFGAQTSWAPHDTFNTTITWIQGPENEGTNDGWLNDISWNFYLGISDRVEAMANMDYISNTDPFENVATSWGIGTYIRVHISDHLRLAQRFEFMRDRQGRSTGVEQTLRENTITLEAQPVADDPRLLVRIEHRRDWSDVPFFSCASCQDGMGLSQDTFTIGTTWVFGPK